MRAITKENIHQVNYYELFGIDHASLGFSNASSGSSSSSSVRPDGTLDEGELRRHFRRFSLLFHPDKDSSPEAAAAFEYVSLALATLLDPVLRQAYDEKCAPKGYSLGKSSKPSSSSSSSHTAAAMAAEAVAAEALLNERDAQQRAAREAKSRAASEKEASAKRMVEELTHSADTSFRVMEQSLIREWNIDEELLRQKEEEVLRLLKQIQCLDERERREEEDGGSGKVKRKKMENGSQPESKENKL